MKSNINMDLAIFDLTNYAAVVASAFGGFLVLFFTGDRGVSILGMIISAIVILLIRGAYCKKMKIPNYGYYKIKFKIKNNVTLPRLLWIALQEIIKKNKLMPKFLRINNQDKYLFNINMSVEERANIIIFKERKDISMEVYILKEFKKEIYYLLKNYLDYLKKNNFIYQDFDFTFVKDIYINQDKFVELEKRSKEERFS